MVQGRGYVQGAWLRDKRHGYESGGLALIQKASLCLEYCYIYKEMWLWYRGVRSEFHET